MLKLVPHKKARGHGEANEQKAFIRWLALQKPFVRALTFSIPNGGTRNPAEAVELKKQGVLSGVCDILVAIPASDCAGLFLEFKYGDGKLSPNQKAFMARVREVGYMAEVVYSWVEAKDILLTYLKDSDYA